MRYLIDLTAVTCGAQHLPNTSGVHTKIYAHGAKWLGLCPRDRRLDHVRYNDGWTAEGSEVAGERAIIIAENGVERARIVPADGDDPTAYTLEVNF